MFKVTNTPKLNLSALKGLKSLDKNLIKGGTNIVEDDILLATDIFGEDYGF